MIWLTVDEKKVVVKVGFEALNIDDNIAAANEITENTINEGEDEEDLDFCWRIPEILRPSAT